MCGTHQFSAGATRLIPLKPFVFTLFVFGTNTTIESTGKQCMQHMLLFAADSMQTLHKIHTIFYNRATLCAVCSTIKKILNIHFLICLAVLLSARNFLIIFQVFLCVFLK